MRIGIFIDEWRDGGVPVFLDRLMDFLTASGNEAYLFLARPHPKREATARKLYDQLSRRLGERCVVLNLPSLPQAWRLHHFKNALLSRGIACLVLNHFIRDIGLLEPLAADIPMVSVAHSDADNYYHEYLLSRRFTRAHIAVSERIEEKTRLMAAPRDGHSIRRIPYGVDPSTQRFRRTPEGPLRVIYSARLDPVQKRCDDLAGIWNLYRAQGGTGHLSILGIGRHEGQLRAGLAREIEASTVSLLGQLAPGDALDRVAEGDVLLNLSNFEGLPQVVLEGAVLGLHPLLSDIESGHREILANLPAGTTCHVGDVEAFARALIDLEHNLTAVRAQRASQREQALAHYAFEDCGQKYLGLLREVALTSPVTRTIQCPPRPLGERLDRVRRLIHHKRHFTT